MPLERVSLHWLTGIIQIRLLASNYILFRHSRRILLYRRVNERSPLKEENEALLLMAVNPLSPLNL